MIDRRSLLAAGAGAVAGSWLGLPGARAADAGTLRIGSLKFGSLSWLLATIKAEGLDSKAGLKLDVVDLATNQAGPIALLSGDCDLIVSDWPWAMRQRAKGEMVKFAPFTTALGAVMVPKDKPIKSLAGLEGKNIGVAGSAIDKSWILLRAYSRKTYGKDIGEIATPVYGAAPLITEELRNGRLDAALNFWPYAARLSGAGYVPLIGMADVMKALGLSPVPALVGYIWREKVQAEKGAAIAAFLAAAKAGNEVLAKSDAAFDRVKDLIKPANEAEFAAIRDFYRSGIPGPWGAAETGQAEKLMQILIESGDKDLASDGTRFDAQLFNVAV